jgi:hypothetical protein
MQLRNAMVAVPQNIIESWQEIVNVLAEVTRVPAALIMRLNAPQIEVFVSSQSRDNPYHARDAERFDGSGLYCETVIKSNDKLLVADALADDHWKNNPDIKLGMVSYLGFPIHYPDGSPFGTLCILDNKHNAYSGTIEKLMVSLRDLLQHNLAILFMNQMLGDSNRRLADYLQELQKLRGLVAICSHCKSIKDAQGQWHPVEHYLIHHPDAMFSHGICPECLKKHY